MEMSYCSSLQLQDDSFLFDCESLLDKSYDPLAYDPAADTGYFSAGSSLSPTSSVDSFCFSPASLQTAGNKQNPLDCFIFNSPAAPHPTHETQSLPCSSSATTASATRKSRSRYPGKKRETASEREKLRMRDLTKALHHLRSYLPPSVAPAGQTLTKIETLRLTIRYISYLSAQLGLSEEALFQRREQGDTSASDTSSPDILSFFQHGSMGGQEAQLQNQSLNQGLYPDQCHSQNTMLHSGSFGFGMDQYIGAPQGDMSMDVMLQSPPATQPSCQVCQNSHMNFI